MPEKKLTRLQKDQIAGAQRDLLEQLFDDHYRFRWRIYKMNFVRGIFFGFGSLIGATILIALLIWVLSLFSGLPVVGNFFQKSQTTIENQAN